MSMKTRFVFGIVVWYDNKVVNSDWVKYMINVPGDPLFILYAYDK